MPQERSGAPVVTKQRPTYTHLLTYSLTSLLAYCGSPVVMKKRPSSSPRKGAMSASIWKRNLVSAKRTPARNCRREGAHA